MKKPSSIRGHVKVLPSTVYLYQKIRPVFSLRAVIHEFFQKKLNYIKATNFFLYDPLAKRLVRLRRNYTVRPERFPQAMSFRTGSKGAIFYKLKSLPGNPPFEEGRLPKIIIHGAIEQKNLAPKIAKFSEHALCGHKVAID